MYFDTLSDETLPVHYFIHNLLLFAGSSAKIDTGCFYAFMCLHIRGNVIKFALYKYIVIIF